MPPVARVTAVEPDSVEAGAHVGEPMLGFFVDMWCNSRCARRMPARADFAPSSIKRHLHHIVIAEALSDFEDFRFRLVGTEVARYFLTHCTGKTIRESYPAPHEAFGACVLKNYRDAAIGQVPLHTELLQMRWQNGLVYDMRAVYLPLSDDGETATSVLTAFSYTFASRPQSSTVN